MLEGAYWSHKLRPLLAKHVALRDAVIVKHASQYTSGLPDFSITIGTRTQWFELKIAPNIPSKLQALMLERLGAAGHLIAVYKDHIELDSLRFGGDNPLYDLVENIVAMCVNKI